MARRLSILLVALALLAACGGAPPAAPAPTDAPAAQLAGAAPAAAPAAAFPVTIEHKYGATTVPAEPQRVVALGYSEVDPLLALGVVPVAVRDWFGEQPGAVWPWSQPGLGGAAPTVLEMPFGELSVETIAALEPDLIVATHSGITEAEYATLAQLAPTLAQSADFPDFGMPWQEQTAAIGRALGREERARQLVDSVEARIADARAASPQLEGATVAWASPAEGGGFWVVGPSTPPLRFLTALGLVYPEAVAGFVGAADSQQLSAERLDLIDTDVLIFYAPTAEARAAIEASPLYQQLGAAREGRVIFFEGDDPVYGALSYSTVASLPYALERLVPMLVAAADGDPATTAAEAPAADPAALQVVEATAEHRLIRHALGEARVPLQPRRVVTLQDQNALLPLFELGFTDVVGSVGDVLPDGSSYFRRMQRFDTSGVQFIGRVYEPNLEAIAALRPDLIVAGQYEITAENYALLSAIAPTVVIQQFTRPIWASHADFALLVNRQAEAQALKARFDARLAEVKARLANPEAITVSLFYVGEGGAINAEADPNLPYHTVFDSLGFSQIALVEQARARGAFYAFEESVSQELLPQLDADLVFVPYWGGEPGADIAALQASPLWAQLNAVRKGQAHIIPGEEWYGLSYQPLLNILDGIERHVIDAALDSSWEPAT